MRLMCEFYDVIESQHTHTYTHTLSQGLQHIHKSTYIHYIIGKLIVAVADSLSRDRVHSDVKCLCQQLFGDMSIEFHALRVTQQRGVEDCGPFACAFIALMASGEDPASISVEQSLLRPWLRQSIEAQNVLPVSHIIPASPIIPAQPTMSIIPNNPNNPSTVSLSASTLHSRYYHPGGTNHHLSHDHVNPSNNQLINIYNLNTDETTLCPPPEELLQVTEHIIKSYNPLTITLTTRIYIYIYI